MTTSGPFLKFLRVAAVALSVSMLVWFVYRSVHRESPTAAGPGGLTNSADSKLEVSAAPVAPGSKSISQPIFSVRESPGHQPLAPSSKSFSQPIFRFEDGDKPVAPSSKSGIIFQEKKGERTREGLAPTPVPSPVP